MHKIGTLTELKRPWGPKKGIVLWDPMHCSSPGFPVLHYLPELAQTHVHWVGDAIQPSRPLSSLSSLALSLSEHQGLFQWVGSSHQVAKVLELQLEHQSFQWIFRVDFLKDGLVFSLSHLPLLKSLSCCCWTPAVSISPASIWPPIAAAPHYCERNRSLTSQL